MTMSVGLARIITDPSASVLVRKALGALSTPGLLVYDTGLSIDDTGRIIIRLNPEGGLIQDENGLALAPVEVTIGIDSEVQLFSQAHDREWNARLTGSAPNYFEAGLTIGSESFSGISPTPGVELQDAKLSVTSTEAQARFKYDEQTFTAFRTMPDGISEVYSVGSNPGFHFITGDGTYENNTGGFRINNGTAIEQIIAVRANAVNFSGGGSAGVTSWQEVTIAVSTDPGHSFRPGQDMVTAMPLNASFLPSEVLAYTARISATDTIALRIAWFDVWAGESRDWLFLVHRLTA